MSHHHLCTARQTPQEENREENSKMNENTINNKKPHSAEPRLYVGGEMSNPGRGEAATASDPACSEAEPDSPWSTPRHRDNTGIHTRMCTGREHSPHPLTAPWAHLGAPLT